MNYSFNGANKIISVADAPIMGTINVDIQELYSRWVDWVLTSDNSKFVQAMRVVGGDPLPGAKQLGLTYFLMNGWKIRPYEADHTFNLTGNIYSEDGTLAFTPTVGSYNVMIVSSVSNLVDLVATGGGTGGLTNEQDTILRLTAKTTELEVINAGIKKASLLVPHTTDI
jgi:hypothetical protein